MPGGRRERLRERPADFLLHPALEHGLGALARSAARAARAGRPDPTTVVDVASPLPRAGHARGGATFPPRRARAPARRAGGRSGGWPPRRPDRASASSAWASARAGPVVELLVALAGAGGRRRRKLELGEGRAKVEPGSAGHDRRPPGGENLVDRCVREPCVLPDGGFVRRAARSADEMRRAESGWFVRIGSPS